MGVKGQLSKACALILMVCLAFCMLNNIQSSAAANDGSVPQNEIITGSGDEYEITCDGEEITLVSCTPASATLEIPSELFFDGQLRKVTKIGKGFLKGNTSVKNITVPSTVKSIGKEAFYGDKKLKTVKITAYSTIKIGKNAFYGIKSKAKFKITASSKIYKKIKTKIKAAGVPDNAKYSRIKETAIPAEKTVAAKTDIKTLDLEFGIYDRGDYYNWEGVTTVSLLGSNGNIKTFCADYDDFVAVFDAEDKPEGTQEGTQEDKPEGTQVTGKVFVTKDYPLYGGMIQDSNGYYYLVTGCEGDLSSNQNGFINVAKYDPNGNRLNSVSDDGLFGFGAKNSRDFATKTPFAAGNCSLCINNGILAVFYGREMMSGHQSNSLLLLNTETLEKCECGEVYQSHSFAQRVIPYEDGFLLVSEGDCYTRAFEVYRVDRDGNTESFDVFNFGVEYGALNAGDMYVLNDNFAALGDIALIGNGNAVLAATSARSMSPEAAQEDQNIFVQIFAAGGDLSEPETYIKGETREGLSGGNGDTPSTDYGVKWLTQNLENINEIQGLHCVVTQNRSVVLIYEKQLSSYESEGVYYMILDEVGTVITEETLFDENVMIPRAETPLVDDNTVWWIGNSRLDGSIRLCSLELL